MENPKFKVTKDAKGGFRFVLQAKNGATILRSSEGYKAKQGCLSGIASVKTNAPLDNRYERSTAKSGQLFFTLKAANGEHLGISEMYAGASGRDNGIESVKSNAPGAPIEDLV